MPRPVACPSCREELDIPDALRGRPVRCAACQTTFTPAADDPPPAVTRRPESRDDDRSYRDEDAPRDDAGRSARGPSRYDRRPAPRRSFLWLWLTLFGAFGLCCLGCGGALFMAAKFGDPDLKVTHKSADGRFEAAFPGPVTVASKTAAGGNAGLVTTTTVEHQRTMFGQPFDRYFVHSTDLKKPHTGRQADAAVTRAVAEYTSRPGSTVRRDEVARVDGADGREIDITYGGDEATVARVFVSGDRLYVVGVTGKLLIKPHEQARLQEFWDNFKLLDKAADADKKGKDKQEPADEDE